MPVAVNGKKICAKCRIEKPATNEFFSRSSGHKDGLKSYCKECLRVPPENLTRRYSKTRVVDGVEEKTCNICGKWLPATSEYFHLVHGKPRAECRECRRVLRGSKLRKDRNDAKIVDGVLSKPCTKCGIWKPANNENYSTFKAGKGGLHPWCRECLNKYAFDRDLRTGRIKAHKAASRTVDGIVQRECRTCKKWFPATDEYFLPQEDCDLGLRSQCRSCFSENRTQYYEATKEVALARTKEWIKNNKDRHRQHAIAVKAKRRAAEGAFKGDDIQEHWNKQNGKCYYCLKVLDQTYEVDHFIPLSKGGTNFPNNIVLACKSCNRAKSAKDPHKFLEKRRQVAAKEGRDSF